MSFDFRTGSRDGVMLIVVDAFTNDSFFIELCDSQLKATLFVNGEPDSCWTQFPAPVLTNDSWVDVNFELTGSKLSLCVKDQHLTKYHRCNLRYPIRGDLFVAGFPCNSFPHPLNLDIFNINFEYLSISSSTIRLPQS